MRRLIATFLLAAALLAQPLVTIAQAPTTPPQVPVSADQTAFVAEVQAMADREGAKDSWFNNPSDVLGADGTPLYFTFTTDSGEQHVYGRSIGMIANLRNWYNGTLLRYQSSDPQLDRVLSTPMVAPDVNESGLSSFSTKEVIDKWISRCEQWSGEPSLQQSYLKDLSTKFGNLRLSTEQIGQIRGLLQQMDKNVDKVFDPNPSSLKALNPCLNATKDIMFTLYNASNGNPRKEWYCALNWFLNPNRSPVSSSGDCKWRADAFTWPYPTPSAPPVTMSVPGLDPASGFPANWWRYCAAMGENGCDPSVCKLHFSEQTGSCQGDQYFKYYKDIEADNKKLADQVTAILGQAVTDTANAQAAALALQQSTLSKGAVLGLNLPLSDISLPDLIARVIKQLLSVVGALALAFFVWGGIRWMLARGAQEEVAKAKKIIVAAVAGLAAIFASYAILSLILNALAK